MTARSILRPRPGVRYSELDGEAVLYEPIGHLVHRLSPAAAAVWLRFDGRPLVPATDTPEPGGPGDPAPTIELARRLRALGLADDADPSNPSDASAWPHAPAPEPAGEVAPPGTVRLPGRLVTGDARPTLVLDPTEGAPSVTLDRPTLVPTTGGAPIGTVLVVDPAATATTPLAGIDALRAIVAQLPLDWFAPDDALDQLADVVDAAAVLTGPSPPP